MGPGVQPAVTPGATGPIDTVVVTTAVVSVGGPHDKWIADGLLTARAFVGDPVPDRVRGLALILPGAQAVPWVPVTSVAVACHLGLGDGEPAVYPAEGARARGPAHRVGCAGAGADAAASARVTSHLILQSEKIVLVSF